MLRMTSWILWLALSLSPLLLTGCDELNPTLTPGERLYRKHCASCHGIDAAGNTPRWMGNGYADLTDNIWKIGGDRTGLEDAIRNGVGEMPDFPDLTDEEVKQIIRHLRTLRGEVGPGPRD